MSERGGSSDGRPRPAGSTRVVVGEGEVVRQLLRPIVDRLDLPEVQRGFVRDRWLDQVVWLQRTVAVAQRRYYLLRLIAVIGAVVVPALAGPGAPAQAPGWVRWAALVVSVVVAAALTVEQFFHYGDRWRHYRMVAERLKSEGWQYFELAGGYADLSCHADGFRRFAGRVEDILGEDVQRHVEEVVVADRAT